MSSKSSYSNQRSNTPSSILIVGSGVFGLGTAYALARRDAYSNTTITVLDRSVDEALFPSRDASSIDTSRIIRADYADPAYAALAAEAQHEWRKQGDDDLGGQGRYSESGLVLVVDNVPSGAAAKKDGAYYCKQSWENVNAMAEKDPSLQGKLKLLPNIEAIRDAVGTGHVNSGVWGYQNLNSGWADADRSMQWLLRKVKETGRVKFVSGTAASLNRDGKKITGVKLSDGRQLSADLVVLATGAWTGGLVDLAGRAAATAQVLAYLDITDEEQAALAEMPVYLNFGSGLFIIPPANNVLKVARHEYGYLNPTTNATPLRSGTSSDAPYTVSLPPGDVAEAFQDIPQESKEALRSALRDMVPIPAIHDRPFTSTRVCWYTDTKSGDFIIDYHPEWEGLFLATGGSGHGFKVRRKSTSNVCSLRGHHAIFCLADSLFLLYFSSCRFLENELPTVSHMIDRQNLRESGHSRLYLTTSAGTKFAQRTAAAPDKLVATSKRSWPSRRKHQSYEHRPWTRHVY